MPLRAARADAPGEALRCILDRGELRILLRLERPPFAFRNEAGELAGHEVAQAGRGDIRRLPRVASAPDYGSAALVLQSFMAWEDLSLSIVAR